MTVETIDIDGIARQIAAELASNETARGVWPDHRLRRWARSGGVVVRGNPEYKVKISPASIDLAVTDYVRRPRWWWRNPAVRRLVWPFVPKKKKDIRKNIDFFWGRTKIESPIVLWPGDFALCSSAEKVMMPNDAVGMILSKSTTGRIGAEHCHSGYVDPGFFGNVTFEFFNPAPWPIELYPGDFYLQLVMLDMSGDVEQTYNGRYQNQGAEPTPARKEVFA